jgi:hypothetical protein
MVISNERGCPINHIWFLNQCPPSLTHSMFGTPNMIVMVQADGSPCGCEWMLGRGLNQFTCTSHNTTSSNAAFHGRHLA